MARETPTAERKQAGELIREYREERGLSQSELAQATGITVDYVDALEAGRISVVYPVMFNALQQVLGFRALELLEAMGYRIEQP